jgi:serine/threonine-protein kinase
MSIVQALSDVEEAIFERALAELPARRGALLDRACLGDTTRRARIERLLCMAETTDGFLEHPPLNSAVETHAVAALHAPGRMIGAYRLLRRLGAGGSAEVWLAERSEGGFRQHAAVKLIRDAHGAMRERFAIEREILASLAHPGIARLYDGGVDPDGSAYMVMEYVEGEHLGAYAQTHALSLTQRLDLFLQICDAVAYAHTRLIVHRDIKPANILVTADGQAKLLDFGIAKLLGAEDDHDVTRTLHLSPSYAAPEQLTGDYVSTATDVYALGVTLFELLAGRLPWAEQSASLATAVKRLVEAPTPLLSRVASADGPVPRRALRGDLDAIVARALRKEAGARYPDARALADDLRRHLEHQPVLARTGARTYVMRRFLRRHWLALSAAATVFLAMALGLTVFAAQAEKVRREAQRAADPIKARQTTARELLDIGAKRIQTQLDDAPENKLALLHLFGDLYEEFALESDQLPVRQQAVALTRHLYGKDSPELVADLIALTHVSSDHAEIERLLDEARAILDHRGEARSFLRGRLLGASAGNHYTTHLEQARSESSEAAAILETFPASPDLAQALFMQGAVASYSGHAEQGIAPLRRAIEVSISAEGLYSPMLSTYYRQLAENQSYALEHADAEASVRKAIEMARADTAEFKYDEVRALSTLVVVLVNADRPRDGLPIALQAKATAPPLSEGIGAGLLRASTLNTSSKTQVRAGELDGALMDAQAAVNLGRTVDPNGTMLGAALQREAEALVELGRTTDAERALDEATEVLKGTGHSPSEFNSILQIRLALDAGRTEDARAQFAALAPVAGESQTAAIASIRRDLIKAEVELTAGNREVATQIASAATARARASALAPYLRSAIADGQMLQGLALLREGNAADARPLLTDALTTRSALYLPKSPRILEVDRALAQCERALGHRVEADALTLQAHAIEAQHSSLPTRYRESARGLDPIFESSSPSMRDRLRP